MPEKLRFDLLSPCQTIVLDHRGNHKASIFVRTIIVSKEGKRTSTLETQLSFVEQQSIVDLIKQCPDLLDKKDPRTKCIELWRYVYES